MMGSDYPDPKLPPDDGNGIFNAVAHVLAGHDIVFGNLEGPLLDGMDASTKCNGRSNCYSFRTPTRYAKHLKRAGFNVMNIANNHASDFGEPGREGTVKTLEEAGILPVGGPKTAVLVIKDRRVAVVGFSTSTSTPYSYSLLDIEGAKDIIRRLDRENDIIIVSFHGGAEGKDAQRVPHGLERFLGEDRGDVRRFAHAVIDAGADLVIGHGPHVLRAMEIYKGRLIAYSLGNFLVYERFNISGPNGISAVLQVGLDPETGKFVSGGLVPVKIVGEGIPETDTEAKAVKIIMNLIRKDFHAAGPRITDDGEILMPKK